jgi:competence protein ComEA
MPFSAKASGSFEGFYKQNKLPIFIGLFGIILLGIGIFTALYSFDDSNSIEIIEPEEKMIFIDLGGAVLNPGVYELPLGSRYKDLLSRAGGLSAEADRDWVEKNLNLAQELDDGIKVYIPSKGEAEQKGETLGLSLKTNINKASSKELETLSGIGEVRAEKIIENRPYASIEDLKTKKIIPENVFEEIKTKIACF